MLQHANSQSNLEVQFFSVRLHAVHDVLSRARASAHYLCAAELICQSCFENFFSHEKMCDFFFPIKPLKMYTIESVWNVLIINLYYYGHRCSSADLGCHHCLFESLLPFNLRTLDVNAASSSLGVVSVFSVDPRDGRDVVRIPAAQWQFVKHWKTSNPSDTEQPHLPRSGSRQALVFLPLEAVNFSECSSPRPHDHVH